MSDLSFGDLIGSGNGIVYSTPTGQVPVEAKYRYNFIYLDVPARAIFIWELRRFALLQALA